MQLISDDELEKIEPLAYQGCSTEIFTSLAAWLRDVALKKPRRTRSD